MIIISASAVPLCGDLCRIVCRVLPTIQSVKGLNLTELNWKKEEKRTIWIRVDCRRSEKKIQNTHKRLKRTLFDRTKQEKYKRILEEVLSFQATYNIKTNNQFTYVSLMLGCWRQENGLAYKKRTSSKIGTFCPVLSNKKSVLFSELEDLCYLLI